VRARIDRRQGGGTRTQAPKTRCARKHTAKPIVDRFRVRHDLGRAGRTFDPPPPAAVGSGRPIYCQMDDTEARRAGSGQIRMPHLQLPLMRTRPRVFPSNSTTGLPACDGLATQDFFDRRTSSQIRLSLAGGAVALLGSAQRIHCQLIQSWRGIPSFDIEAHSKACRKSQMDLVLVGSDEVEIELQVTRRQGRNGQTKHTFEGYRQNMNAVQGNGIGDGARKNWAKYRYSRLSRVHGNPVQRDRAERLRRRKSALNCPSCRWNTPCSYSGPQIAGLARLGNRRQDRQRDRRPLGCIGNVASDTYTLNPQRRYSVRRRSAAHSTRESNRLGPLVGVRYLSMSRRRAHQKRQTASARHARQLRDAGTTRSSWSNTRGTGCRKAD